MYIKVDGQWTYLQRAVDRDSETVCLLLTAKGRRATAHEFLRRAIALHGEPEKTTVGKSGAISAAICSDNAV